MLKEKKCEILTTRSTNQPEDVEDWLTDAEDNQLKPAVIIDLENTDMITDKKRKLNCPLNARKSFTHFEGRKVTTRGNT